MHPLLQNASAIIFDFDGVLVDSEPLHAEAIRRTAGMLGWAMTPGQFLRMIGKGDEHAFELLARENGRTIDPGEVARLCDRKHEECLLLIGEHRFSVQPGAAELVALAAERAPVGVCSGSRSGVVRGMLNRSGMAGAMRTVVTHEDVANPKPAPDGYLLAAARLNTDPRACVAIEDSPTGLLAAKDAGMKVIAVCHSFAADQLSLADVVVERIADLCRRCANP
ncbi:MAG: HAD family hydrolase [Phycisphaerales bacterium]